MPSYLKPFRGTYNKSTYHNITLENGEIFFEMPNAGAGKGEGRIKMGDGVTPYNYLPYFINLDSYLTSTKGFKKSTTGDSASLATVISSLANTLPLADSRSYIRRGFELINQSLSGMSSNISSINSTLNTGVGKSLAYNSTSKQVELRNGNSGKLSGVTVGYATNAASADSATNASTASYASRTSNATLAQRAVLANDLNIGSDYGKFFQKTTSIPTSFFDMYSVSGDFNIEGHHGIIMVGLNGDGSHTSREYVFAFWYINNGADYGSFTVNNRNMECRVLKRTNDWAIQARRTSGSGLVEVNVFLLITQ